MITFEIENIDLNLIHESIKRADNNKEFVLDEDSYSEIDYLDLMSKKELLNLKKEILKNFQQIYIGNPNTYSYCDKNGAWDFAKKGRITLNLIEKHLKKELTLGSYYAYKLYNREYCRWICFDFDLHPLILEDGTVFDNSKKIKSIKFPIKLYDERKKKQRIKRLTIKKNFLNIIGKNRELSFMKL